jgi:hypothetical protein
MNTTTTISGGGAPIETGASAVPHLAMLGADGCAAVPVPPLQMPVMPSRGVLTPEQKKKLALYKGIIDTGLTGFLQVGAAIMAIRDERLFLETHDTFDGWCQENYGWTSRRARQYIAAAETVQNLEVPRPDGRTSSVFMLPASEAQVRPLVSLPPEEQRAAWAEAVATAPGRLTKRHVETIVRARRGLQPAPPPPPAEKSAEAEPPQRNGTHVPLPGPIVDVLPAGSRETRVSEAADRAIAGVRELRDVMGTPDSVSAADVDRALDDLQKLKDHLVAVERMQASRKKL